MVRTRIARTADRADPIYSMVKENFFLLEICVLSLKAHRGSAEEVFVLLVF
jgi:hypothetical protein